MVNREQFPKIEPEIIRINITISTNKAKVRVELDIPKC